MMSNTLYKTLLKSQLTRSQLIVNLSKVEGQIHKWNTHLPSFRPHYAVKCNPSVKILETLNKLNTGFDCASVTEIKTVLKINPNASIIYANPVKSYVELKEAFGLGIRRITLDSVDELDKCKEFKDLEIVIRIEVDDSGSVCRFSKKFGATIDEAKKIILLSKERGIKIIGVSFHVGSNCSGPNSYIDAINQVGLLFDYSKKHSTEMKFLDIGGGFLANDSDTIRFSEIALGIEKTLKEKFHPTTECIGEPGRFIVANSSTLITNVIGKKEKKGNKMYYIDNGVYGLLNCQVFDYYFPKFTIHHSAEQEQNSELILHPSIIFGPTCDSLDTVREDVYLPELSIGDKVIFENFGAYTEAATTFFNGLNYYDTHYI